MKKIVSFLTIIVFMMTLVPWMVNAEDSTKEKIIIDFGKIHHTADMTREQISAKDFLLNKGLLVDAYYGGSIGMDKPYLASPDDKPLVNIDMKDEDDSFTAYPIHKAENVSEEDNIEYEFTEDDRNDQSLGNYSSLLNKYSGIIVKFGEDQEESEDIIITVEELTKDSLTTRQRYSMDFLYNKKVLNQDNFPQVTNAAGKILFLFNAEDSDSTISITDGLTEEDNVIYELTEEDFSNNYSRFDGKKRIILKLSETPAPKENVNNVNNPETNPNGLIVWSVLLVVTTTVIILNGRKRRFN